MKTNQKTVAKKKTVVPSKQRFSEKTVARMPYVAKDVAAEKELKSDAFPLVSVLPKADMKRAIEILQDDVEFAEQIKSMTDARAEMKNELVEIYKRNKLKSGGIRWGTYAAYIKQNPGKKTLSAELVKEAWVEAGMAAEAVEEFYVTGKPYAEVRIMDLSKAKTEA